MKEAPLIAHVVFRFDVGGLENGVVNLINRIPDDRYRHAIIVLTEYTDFRLRLNRDIPLFALHKRPGKDLGLHLRLWRLLRRLQPDVVHTRNLNALEAQLPAFLAGVPGRVHGEHGWDVHDLTGASRKYRWWRRLFRPFVRRYIPLSLHLADYLRGPIGVPAQRIACICNGVDVQKFCPPAHGFRDALPDPGFADEDVVVIGTVGRMETVKDQVTLARAFVLMVRQHPGARQRLRLVMVGEGALRAQVMALLQQEGLAQFAWLPGKRQDAAQLLRAFDVFVLPSLAEGISNTILEAMASGRPVVATDVGGNGELVVNGETGRLVPSADPQALATAIWDYVDSPDLRTRHGAAGRARAEQRFSIDRMVADYLSVYDSVLPAPHPDRLRDVAGRS